MSNNLIINLSTLSKEDTDLVGDLGSTLAKISEIGIPISEGFIVSTKAFKHFLIKDNLNLKIGQLLNHADFNHHESVQNAANNIKKLIMTQNPDVSFIMELFAAYKKLGGVISDAGVMIQPSLLAKSYYFSDIKVWSLKGEANLLYKLKETWASVYSAKNLYFKNKFNKLTAHIPLAVLIQKELKSNLRGKLYTVNPKNTNKQKILIEAESTTHKQNFEAHKFENLIVKKSPGTKQLLTDKQILDLAQIAQKLDRLFYFPTQVNWILIKGKFYVEKVQHLNFGLLSEDQIKSDNIAINASILFPGIAVGPLRIIKNSQDLLNIKSDEILYFSDLPKSFDEHLKKAHALIFETTQLNHDLKNVMKKIGKPAVFAIKLDKALLINGTLITVNATKGYVIRGGINKPQLQTTHSTADKLATKIFLEINSLNDPLPDEKYDAIYLNIKNSSFNLESPFKKSKVESFVNYYSKYKHVPLIYKLNSSMEEIKNLESELEMIKIYRNKFNYKNISILSPVMQSVEDFARFKRLLSSTGLHRSLSFKIWLNCSNPSNAINIDKYLKLGVDGIFIEADNLFKLTTGFVTKDNNSINAAINNSDNLDAVFYLYQKVLNSVNNYNIPSTISGVSLLTNTRTLEKLIKVGITGITIPQYDLKYFKSEILKHEHTLMA